MGNEKDYYLGLDMGTGSVGWAVTDENYHLLRFKGKDMWGMREFEGDKNQKNQKSSLAADRRSHRCSRRRLERKKLRISIVKSIFDDAIREVDPDFFVRLDNSKYFMEDKDKRLKSNNGIFNDPDYDDKKYFHDYPTIYHLRSDLIHKKGPFDVRKVYLAIENLFKRRGNFLDDSFDGDTAGVDLETLYHNMVSSVNECLDIKFPDQIDFKQFSDLLCNRYISKTEKTEKLISFFELKKSNKKEILILKLMTGQTVKTKDFDNQIDKSKIKSFTFSDGFTDECRNDVIENLGDEVYQTILIVKRLYDYSFVHELLGDHKYLSDARVEKYNEHAEDLKLLKKVTKTYGTKKDFDYLFRNGDDGSYSAYVNSSNSKDVKKRRGYKKRTREEFYKKVNSYFAEWEKDHPEMKDDPNVQKIKERISSESFMPKQLTGSNGSIPNQLHFMELHKILENAKGYLDFLNKKDKSGLTAAERIEKLYQFNIPYYVGPTSENSKKHGYGWVVRKEPGLVLPWNIEEKIDLKKTSEEFINQLISRCTYLYDEKVMPKSSLLYEKFCVLNEINNIKIDEEPISVKLKQGIYNELFKKGKKVKRSSIDEYLKGQGAIKDASQVTGIDSQINNYLSSYGKFKAVFGDDIDKDKYQKIAEDIIRWSTIYSDSKKFLKEQLDEKYGNELSDNQLKRILGFKFKDWARLSKAFLELQGLDKETGEYPTIIDCMWNTNNNLMQLLHSDRFTFGEELEKKQAHHLKKLSEFTYEDLQDMYFSAPVKRMIWQTIRIIKEIKAIMGKYPKRIFIEMTRQEDDKKERKASRGERLLNIYKSIKEDFDGQPRDWQTEIKNNIKEDRFKIKKLYLYYTQMGRDMYTGEPIELSDLFGRDKYDIDHIYPRHFTKDDSLVNNLVLVRKDINNDKKKDNYPIEESIRKNSKVKKLWKELVAKRGSKSEGLISEEKYHRLTRSTPFTDDEKAQFIARQLVETSQATKGVADVLKELLPKETTIVYAKAANVSRFRQQFNIPKSRLVNDFHHAHDAYLNIVVGNAYYVKFTQDPRHFIKEEYDRDPSKYKYNLSKMFKWDIKRNDEVAWIAPNKDRKGGTISTVKKTLSRNTPILSIMSFTGHGQLFEQNATSAKKAKAKGYYPLKSDARLQDVTKYGGFSSPSTAYFCLVKYDVGKKTEASLEAIPLWLSEEIDKNPNKLLDYFRTVVGLKNPVILMEKIKLNSTFKRDGMFVCLTGKTNTQVYLNNATNLCLKPYWIKYIKKLENVQGSLKIDDIITKEENIKLYDELISKFKQTVYKDRPASQLKVLESNRNKFIELSMKDQITVIIQILNLTKIGKNKADLELINVKGEVGTMKCSKKLSRAHEFILINRSVTGLYEKRIDLLKLWVGAQ